MSQEIRKKFKRKEHTRRNRDEHDIVKEGGEKVLFDSPHSNSAQLDRFGNAMQVPAGKNHVARLYGDVRPCADSQSHVGLSQGRGVIDPFPDFQGVDLVRVQIPSLFSGSRLWKTGTLTL